MINEDKMLESKYTKEHKMEFTDCAAYKYIRTSNDEFRFEKLSCFCRSHKDLIKEDEFAISAGTIGIYPNKFMFVDRGSITLNLFSSLESDIKFLETITKRKVG